MAGMCRIATSSDMWANISLCWCKGRQQHYCLCRQLILAQKRADSAVSDAAIATAHAAAAETTAAERHRKFVLLNAGYRKKEDDLRARVEAAEADAARSAAACTEARQMATALQKVGMKSTFLPRGFGLQNLISAARF